MSEREIRQPQAPDGNADEPIGLTDLVWLCDRRNPEPPAGRTDKETDTIVAAPPDLPAAAVAVRPAVPGNPPHPRRHTDPVLAGCDDLNLLLDPADRLAVVPTDPAGSMPEPPPSDPPDSRRRPGDRSETAAATSPPGPARSGWSLRSRRRRTMPPPPDRTAAAEEPDDRNDAGPADAMQPPPAGGAARSDPVRLAAGREDAAASDAAIAPVSDLGGADPSAADRVGAAPADAGSSDAGPIGTGPAGLPDGLAFPRLLTPDEMAADEIMVDGIRAGPGRWSCHDVMAAIGLARTGRRPAGSAGDCPDSAAATAAGAARPSGPDDAGPPVRLSPLLLAAVGLGSGAVTGAVVLLVAAGSPVWSPVDRAAAPPPQAVVAAGDERPGQARCDRVDITGDGFLSASGGCVVETASGRVTARDFYYDPISDTAWAEGMVDVMTSDGRWQQPTIGFEGPAKAAVAGLATRPPGQGRLPPTVVAGPTPHPVAPAVTAGNNRRDGAARRDAGQPGRAAVAGRTAAAAGPAVPPSRPATAPAARGEPDEGPDRAPVIDGTRVTCGVVRAGRGRLVGSGGCVAVAAGHGARADRFVAPADSAGVRAEGNVLWWGRDGRSGRRDAVDMAEPLAGAVHRYLKQQATGSPAAVAASPAELALPYTRGPRRAAAAVPPRLAAVSSRVMVPRRLAALTPVPMTAAARPVPATWPGAAVVPPAARESADMSAAPPALPLRPADPLPGPFPINAGAGRPAEPAQPAPPVLPAPPALPPLSAGGGTGAVIGSSSGILGASAPPVIQVADAARPAVTGPSGDGMTRLESAIATAIRRAPDETVVARRLDAARRLVEAAERERLNPHLEGVAQASYDVGGLTRRGADRGDDGGSFGWGVGVRLAIDLYDGGRAAAAAGLARARTAALQADRRDSQAALADVLRLVHWEARIAGAHRTVLRRYRVPVTDWAEIVNRLFADQYATHATVVLASQLVLGLDRRQRRLDRALALYRAIWLELTGQAGPGLGNGQGRGDTDWPVLPAVPAAPALIALVPDSVTVLRARAGLGEDRAALARAQAARRPTLSMQGESLIGREASLNGFVGMRLAVPLYDNGVGRARVGAHRQSVAGSTLATDAAARDLAQAVQQDLLGLIDREAAVADAMSALVLVESRLRQLDLVGRTLRSDPWPLLQAYHATLQAVGQRQVASRAYARAYSALLRRVSLVGAGL